jgi:hypothetical protein
MNCSICQKNIPVISETNQEGNPILICEECKRASNNNNEDSPPAEVKTVCRNHPTIEVDLKCDKCGAFICKTCAFPQPSGKSLCPQCMKESASGKRPPLEPHIPDGTMCCIHPNVPAVQICQICKKTICKTCCFEFPNDIHICPNCVNKPFPPSPKQKKNLVISYVLSSTATLGFIFCMFMQRLFETPIPAQLAGFFFMAIVLAPAITGLSFAINASSRNRKKPISIWISMIWNSFLIVLFLILTLVGLFMR